MVWIEGVILHHLHCGLLGAFQASDANMILVPCFILSAEWLSGKIYCMARRFVDLWISFGRIKDGLWV